MKMRCFLQTRPPGKTVYFTGLVILLLIFITPTFVASAALDDAARWTRVNIPSGGEAGKWVLAKNSDVRHLTSAGDGTLYAFVHGLAHTLYRSDDDGASWSYIGNVQDEIVDIAVSPHDFGTIYYATKSDVYFSTDNGTFFYQLPASPGGAGTNNIEITSIDVTWYDNHIVAVGTRDTDNDEFGDVYILEEAIIHSGWMPTEIGDYDIYAVAFSPQYAIDFQLVAVLTDEIDTFTASRRGSMEWNALTDMARLGRDNTDASVVIAAPAAVAFPDNYDLSPGSSNCVYYVGINTGTGDGDVYRIDGNNTPYVIATDLNAGYMYGFSNVDITGLSAAGAYPGVSLLAGAANSPHIYSSSDGGINWEMSLKGPTGETDTCVLLAPDFANNGVAYAASSGTGSAFSVSRDKGNTWNQLSLIDDTIITLVDMVPSPCYDEDTTLFLITFGTGHSLWRTSNDGSSWERVFSTHLGDADTINRVGLPPQYGYDCQTVFVAGEKSGQPAIWKSADNGQEYRRRYSKHPENSSAFHVDTWAIADENTLFAGGFDGINGVVCKTINSGFFYLQSAPAGNQSLHSLVLSPNYKQDGNILVGNTDGGVYWSDNDGLSFKPLPSGTGSPPLTGAITVAFDPDFARNNTVYAANDTADSGIYRFVVGESTEWENIDDTLPASASLSRVITAESGVLYSSNYKTNGGMERCLNPAAGAVFETVTQGLDDDASLSGLWLSGCRLWSLDTVNNALLTYNDTLASPIDLVSPENGAPGAGNAVDNTIRKVILDWETLEGATSYQWRCDNDNNFSSIPDGLEAVTPVSYAHLPALEPATTYYWQVRANAPVAGPWSEKRMFTTIMVSETVPIKMEIPAAGSSGIPVRPVFQWTAIDGANGYELLVSPNADFSSPAIDKKGDHKLTSNAWQSDVLLDRNTTYYWKVRAVSATTYSGWSAAGTFTTESLPITEPEDEPEETESLLPSQSPDITPASILSLQQVAPTEPPVQTPTPTAESMSPQLPYVNQEPILENWVLYLIGGLIAAIMFALVIIFMMVLKMRRL